MQVEEGLKPIEGYMLSLKRDTMNGWYEMEIGLPAGWIFRGNDFIECEVIKEIKTATLIKIYPKVDGIVVDDLISFVELILATNSKIAEKEKEFTDSLEESKEQLNAVAVRFYTELDDLKKKSFSNFDTENEVVPPPPPPPEPRLIKEGEKPPSPPKRGRGRPAGSKNKPKVKSVSGATK